MTTTDPDPSQHTPQQVPHQQAVATPASPTRWALPALTALALLVDAVVHLHLAPGYQLTAPRGIGAGNLFRIEAALALAVAVWVLLAGTRRSFAAAFLVGISALGAVLLYRYVNVPMLGPLPAMYEPAWFPEKTLSAVAEAVAAVVAAGALLMRVPPRSRQRGNPTTKQPTQWSEWLTTTTPPRPTPPPRGHRRIGEPRPVGLR